MKKVHIIIGVMSGTSLDGLDVACCNFESDGNSRWNYEIIASICYPYNQAWRQRLGDAHSLNGLDLMLFDNQFGAFIGNAINDFINRQNLKPDLIASHGHTVFHQPEQKLSFQVGAGSAMYAVTGIPVVCDFRSVDVNLGGQGAPLVPVGDALLFNEYDYCLNLGGIANISYDEKGKRMAYDICGCNLLLNAMANEKGFEFDENGDISQKGLVYPELLADLNSLDYHQWNPPKSLDKETMLSQCLPLIRSWDISTEDKLATLVEYISDQVSKAIILHSGSMLISGGGVLNSTLIAKIKSKSALNVIIPAPQIIHFKEALIFAFLGLLRALNQDNVLSTVTGASLDSIGGALYGKNPYF